MSGSNSFGPGVRGAPDPALTLAVHSMPAPPLEPADRRTTRGRLKMLLVLLVCAAPVVASYLAYFVIRPSTRTNYGELIVPQRPIPPGLVLAGLDGKTVAPAALRGQWLVVVVAGGACDARCEKYLWLQRQLRETLGREKERVDKLWLVIDAASPSPRTLAAISAGAPATVLRVAPAALAGWLAPAPGQALADHLYLVDPIGHWMMRMPVDPEPSRLKRDLDRLLRASASWDRDGR